MIGKCVNEEGVGYQVRANDLPVALQPREKFDRLGPENLSESDLLALILRTGAKGLNVVELAEHILVHYGSLSALSRASTVELYKEFHGIGKEKAKILKSALEIGRRLVNENVGRNPRVAAPEEVASILRERARGLDREVVWVLLIDSKNRLIAPPVDVSKGTLNSSLIHPREVFKPAIQHSAANIILAHNHPSGDPTPSTNDIKVTKKLVEAGQLMEIKILDHIIIGHKTSDDVNDFFSMRESGYIEF